MERKNINRGFKKLRVWQDAVSPNPKIFLNNMQVFFLIGFDHYSIVPV
jgi:hypothetical protein